MKKQIIMVGNGSNYNRGCEAIARGTLALFQAIAPGDFAIKSGVIVHDGASENMIRSHRPDLDEPLQFPIMPRLDNRIATRIADTLFRGRSRFRFSGLADNLAGATHVLEVGGDNYSLDYGRPHTFIDLDREVDRSGAPLAIWGASVGPFSADKEFEAKIKAHLRSVDHIFVRGDRLARLPQIIGADKCHDYGRSRHTYGTQDPTNIDWDLGSYQGAIGLNFPFQARQLSKSAHAYWETDFMELEALAEFGAELIRWLLRSDDRPIMLTPHVMAPEVWNNDHILLSSVRNRLEDTLRQRVAILPPSMTAPEIKCVIGRCSIFAGESNSYHDCSDLLRSADASIRIFQQVDRSNERYIW